MRGIKTRTIKINNLPPAATLAAIFRRAKEDLEENGKIPIRMVVLNHKKGSANLLVSFIYEYEKQ